MTTTRPTHDEQLLCAAEVYRNRMITELEAGGARIVEVGGRMVADYLLDIVITDWRTGEELLTYAGPLDGLAAARAAVDDPAPWAELAEIVKAAAWQAVQAVPEPVESANTAA